jgi:hypothetical protein
MATPKKSPSNPLNQFHNSVLSGFEKAYCQRLSINGYAQGTQEQYLNCVTHFATWMQASNISLCEFGPDLIVQFLEKHLPDCHCPL